MRRLRFALLLAFLPATGGAQELTPHPESWRPIVYRDLQVPGPEDRPYADLWADEIAKNNRRYKEAGDTRYYAVGNAPVREAHVVVRGGDKVALLSILNTATACSIVAGDELANIKVKLCPMRLAFWKGASSTIRQGKGCYLEPGPRPQNFTPDPSFAVSYASYDVESKSIKLGVILAHQAVDACSQTVPLYPTQAKK